MTRSQHDSLLHRVEDVARDISRVPAYPGNGPSQPARPIVIGVTAHGWTLGTPIRNTGLNLWAAAIADTAGGADDDKLAVVIQVIDANHVLAVLQGPCHLDGLTAYTTYYLSATVAGQLTDTPPASFASPNDTFFRRAVLYHNTDGDCWVFGSTIEKTHGHRLMDLRDVLTATPSDQDVLAFDMATGQWKSQAISAVVPDATAIAKGVIQLDGDLAGTAASPQLAAIIAAGTLGGSNQSLVLSWDTKGRVVSATTATITPAAIGAIPDPASPATGDYLRWDGSAWSEYSLGDLSYDPAADWLTIGGTATELLIKTKIRVDSLGDIRWVVRGSIAGSSDKYARLIVAATDQLQLQDDGTEVARWTTSSTAASRNWQWKMDVTMVGKHLTVDGTADLRWAYDATPHYATIAGDAGNHILFSDNGTEVMRWVCDPSVAANRQLRVYMPLVLSDNGGNDWKLTADGLGRLHYNYAGADWFVFDGNGGGVVTARYYVDVTVDSGKAIKLRNGAGAYLTDDGTANNVGRWFGNLAVKSSSPANGDLSADGVITSGTAFLCGTLGLTGTVTLKAISLSNGSLTFQGGIITAYTAPT